VTDNSTGYSSSIDVHRTVQYLSPPLTYKGGREADFGLPHLYLDGGVVHSSLLKAGIVPLGRSVSDGYLIWLMLLLLLLWLLMTITAVIPNTLQL
jgi:hypothetical protein